MITWTIHLSFVIIFSSLCRIVQLQYNEILFNKLFIIDVQSYNVGQQRNFGVVSVPWSTSKQIRRSPRRNLVQYDFRP